MDTTKIIIILTYVFLILALAVGLGVGLGLDLKPKNDMKDENNDDIPDSMQTTKFMIIKNTGEKVIGQGADQKLLESIQRGTYVKIDENYDIWANTLILEGGILYPAYQTYKESQNIWPGDFTTYLFRLKNGAIIKDDDDSSDLGCDKTTMFKYAPSKSLEEIKDLINKDNNQDKCTNNADKFENYISLINPDIVWKKK